MSNTSMSSNDNRIRFTQTFDKKMAELREAFPGADDDEIDLQDYAYDYACDLIYGEDN